MNLHMAGRTIFTGDPDIDERILQELRYNQSRWTEIWISCIMVLYGLILLINGDTFGNQFYVVIRLYVHEETAGLISFFTGVVRLAALYINGSWRRTPLIRILGCTGGFLYFSALTFGFYLAGPPYSGVMAVYAVLAVAELHSSNRAARDAFAYDSLNIRKRRRERAERDTDLC